MPGNYSITTRTNGEIIDATKYNTDHQNHVDNNTPAGADDYSVSVAQMRSQVDPGESGSESLATSLAGELERLRFAIKELKGTTYWYETAAWSAPTGYIRQKTTVQITMAAGASERRASGAIPVNARVTSIIVQVATGLGLTQGLTGFSVGDSLGGGSIDRWGNNVSPTQNTKTSQKDFASSDTPIAAAASDVILTAIGGLFDATGVVNVSIYYETTDI